MKIKVDRETTYKTVMVLALALLIARLIFKSDYFLYAGIGLLLLSLAAYKIAWYITWVWLKFSHLIGTVQSKIILSIIFYIFLTPLALLFQLTGKKIHRRKENHGSYFHTRNHLYKDEDLKNTW